MTPPPFWNFSENSSVLEGEGVPNLKGFLQIWMGPLAGDAWVVVVVNR